MGFSQALSGLNASATNLDVIGNNIANSQTVGFKSGRSLFSDVYANAKVGLGTHIAGILQTFTSGNLENTGRNLDIAISGNGFFRLEQNGGVVYSRNGQLSLDSSGFLENVQGAKVTGFPNGEIGTDPEPIRIDTSGLTANATTSISAVMNLDANADVVDRLVSPFDSQDEGTYTFSSNVTIFDSQGNSHGSTIYYTKIGDNNWDVRLERENELAPEVGELTFDENGLTVSSTGLDSFTFTPPNGVAAMDIRLNINDATQFGNEFELTSLQQDGYTAGSLVGIFIDENGGVIANYSNDQTVVLSTIAIANFTNDEGLKPVGDNAWVETTDSGQPLVNGPGFGLAGTVSSGIVENSNVDLTKELVNLIGAQRNYQANAQTIKVQDEVLQSAVNLR